MWASGPHTDSGGVDAASTAGLESGATRMRNLRMSSKRESNARAVAGIQPICNFAKMGTFNTSRTAPNAIAAAN